MLLELLLLRRPRPPPHLSPHLRVRGVAVQVALLPPSLLLLALRLLEVRLGLLVLLLQVALLLWVPSNLLLASSDLSLCF
jgi:hypothetical protein